MAVFLVRHAVAVGRSHWDDDDSLRPLTSRGRRQAHELAEALKGEDVQRILTSPAVRCRDTVQPLGQVLGLPVDDADALAEGAAGKAALQLAEAQAALPGATVLCTHGDVIPELLRRLGREGLDLGPHEEYAKGSYWRLDADGATFVKAAYVPPLA